MKATGLIAKAQKIIYDGKEHGYEPIYADAFFFKNYLQQQVRRAGLTGRFGFNLKSIRNAKELARLNLRPGQKVLDAGCGGGILINQLVALYKVQGHGVDLSTLALKRAREAGSKSIRYKQGILEAIPWPANSFDALTSFDVLEHVEAKAQALAEIVRVLKPGGRALLYAVSSRDALTWHWCLRFFTLGRLGQDNEAGHSPELMASPELTRQQVEAAGGRVLRLSYLHSFFTLIADEAIGWFAGRRHQGLKQAPVDAGKSKALPTGGALYRVLQGAEVVLDCLEWPWKAFGFSNGFFVLIEKPGQGRKIKVKA